MSTLSDQIAAQVKAEKAAAAKPKKKPKTKRDENGRFVKKDDPDLDTPSL